MGKDAAIKRARREEEPDKDAPAELPPELAAAAEDLDAFLATFTPEQVAAAMAELEPRHQLLLEADVARTSFKDFVVQAWPYVPQVDPYVDNWHVDVMTAHAEACARGEIEDLGVNIPPGHAKSVIWSVLLPAWIWTWWPRAQFLCCSYSGEHAKRDSGRCRDVIASEWYQKSFARPNKWTLHPSLNMKHWFANTAGGEYFATGTGGAGKRAHIIIVDDALDIDKAHSETERQAVVRWLSQTISQRFIAGAPRRFILVGQRLAEGDPFDWFKSRGGELLAMPSEFEPASRTVTHRVVNGEREEFYRDPRKAPGELLFPALFTRSKINQARLDLGPFGFAAQHQQRPAPEGGGLFKVENWRFWTADHKQLERYGLTLGVAARPEGCSKAQANHVDLDRLQDLLLSVDATFEETTDGSYVVIDCWGRLGARRLLIHKIRRRMDFTDTVDELKRMIRMFPRARRRLVEAKANGSAIINTLEKTHGITGCIPVNPGRASKVERAHAMLPYQAAQNVELADGAAWMPQHIEEHAAFPNGASDDNVDCQSQGLQGFEAEKTTAQKWARGGR